MNNFKSVNPIDFSGDFAKMFGTNWALLTTEKDGHLNTMTIGWGEIGCLFGKAVATVFVRPSRHTYNLIDNADSYSITFFPQEFKEKLTYCGKISGRDENKIEKCGFTVAYQDGVPYFEEASTVVICKAMYKQDLNPDNFEAAYKKQIMDRFFPSGDFHRIYTGEITSVLEK